MKGYKKLKEVIQKANPEKYNIQFRKKWEQDFYEGDWECDTLKYSKTEKRFVESLNWFLPRHMAVYDWNLPYIDAIILKIRRHFIKITLADVLLACNGVGRKEDEILCVDATGNFTFETMIESGKKEYRMIEDFGWNLKDDNLDNQSDETKQFLINLRIK